MVNMEKVMYPHNRQTKLFHNSSSVRSSISAIVFSLIEGLIYKIKSIMNQRRLPQTKEIHNSKNLDFSRLRNNMGSIR